MVRRILTNEVYIGNLVQGKQTTPNHKVKKTIIKEKCEWIRIEADALSWGYYVALVRALGGGHLLLQAMGEG